MTIRDAQKFVDTLWDWSCLDGCFPRSTISPTDLDCGLRQHLTEIKGFFLLMECKLPGNEPTVGQKRTHDSLINTGKFSIIIIHGYGKNLNIHKLQKRTHNNPLSVDIDPSLESLRKHVKKWSNWAESKPPHPSDDVLADVEWFNERAGILEYDAGYPREEAEKLAMQMMIERRLQIETGRATKAA